MMAGIVMSAIMGGLAGLAFSVTRDYSVLQSIFSYQIGGTLAVLSFIAMAQASCVSQEEEGSRLK